MIILEYIKTVKATRYKSKPTDLYGIGHRKVDYKMEEVVDYVDKWKEKYIKIPDVIFNNIPKFVDFTVEDMQKIYYNLGMWGLWFDSEKGRIYKNKQIIFEIENKKLRYHKRNYEIELMLNILLSNFDYKTAISKKGFNVIFI